MNSINCIDAGKRYNRDWIFRHCTVEFHSHHSYAILGPNGSGKSTFMKAISGYLTLTEGNIEWRNNTKSIPVTEVYQQVSMVAPYLELVEELTVEESIDFHFRFKQWLPGWQKEALIARLDFQKHRQKAVRDLSSGMRQRIKLGLALTSHTSLALLDEPATNLDKAGVAWYHQLVEETRKDRLIIVASNREDEYAFCTEMLSVTDWKS